MTLRIVSVAFLLLASACATTAGARDERPDPAFAKAISGKVAGKPRSCISLSDSHDSTTYRTAIVYRISSRLSYVNDLGKCPYLGNDNILVTKSFGSQLCRGDIAQMIDRGGRFPTGSCAMSDFVPYETPGK